MHEAGVHLLEIDLIRRGERPFNYPNLPKSHYRVTLVRAETEKTDIWAFNIQDPLPTVPVPLDTPDENRLLQLGKVLQDLYDRSRYEFSIDYEASPPPPTFSEEELAWIEGLLSSGGQV